MIAAQELLQANVLTEVFQAAPTRGNEMATTVFICNQDGGQWSTVDLALSRGEQDIPASRQYLYRGYSLRPNETLRPKLYLRDGDSVRVRATTARVSVAVSAEEIVTPRALETIESRLDALIEEWQEYRAEHAIDTGVMPPRPNTRLVRHTLMLEKTVASLGNEISGYVSLEFATQVESLMLRASSVSGAADVKAEFAVSWDTTEFTNFDDTADITSSTNTDRANNPEGWNTYSVAAPLNRYIRIRITGVGANPADTIVSAYLIVREGYAT